MNERFNLRSVKFICKYWLNVEWFLKIEDDEEFMTVIRKCSSKLEILYLLGALHHIHQENRKLWPYNELLEICAETREDCEGLTVPVVYGSDDQNRLLESSVFIAPQYASPQKDIRHDFAFFVDQFIAPNKTRPMVFLCAVEIDGRNAHKHRRDKDDLRDSGLSYPVVRAAEELTEEQTWFAELVGNIPLLSEEYYTVCHLCNRPNAMVGYEETALDQPYCQYCMKDTEGNPVTSCEVCGISMHRPDDPEDGAICKYCWDHAMSE